MKTIQLCAALAITASAAPHAAAAEAGSPVQSYYDLVYWVSLGRTDEAVEQFTEQASVIAGPDCTREAPCVGRKAIRERYIAELLKRNTGAPLSDQRFDGEYLRTYGEVVGGPSPLECTTRLIGGHSFGFDRGRIASVRFELDTSDPQTAAFVARRSAEAATARR